MNQQCKILCDKLEEKTNEEEFNVYPMVTHCALDIICETAMGKKLNSQENSNTPYVEALYKGRPKKIFLKKTILAFFLIFMNLKKLTKLLWYMFFLPFNVKILTYYYLSFYWLF